ncbi:MAG: hypothetical protein J4G05_09685 [Chlorobi bacterium]|nr:hypothetical protein [Chlorobiota bacterium]
MYKDIISYKLAENISEEHLLNVASDVLKYWMSTQSGFIKWEIHKNNDGGYTDIVYWESKDDAKKAEADMVNIPNANDWYSCYEKGSISSINLNQVATFN